MKTVLVNPSILAPGTESDVLIDPESDILSEENDPIVFVEQEPVLVRFVDSTYETTGFVRKIHEDEFGEIIQLAVDWEGAYLKNE